jgi:hypothetical protein
MKQKFLSRPKPINLVMIEYRVLEVNGDDLEKVLNEYAKEGWVFDRLLESGRRLVHGKGTLGFFGLTDRYYESYQRILLRREVKQSA